IGPHVFSHDSLPLRHPILPLLPLWSQHRQRGDRGDRRRWRLARRQCFRSHDRIHARFCFAAAIYVLCVPSLPLRPYAICSLATCAGAEPRIVAGWHERLATLLAGHALTPLSCHVAGTLSASCRLTCVRAYDILRLRIAVDRSLLRPPPTF